MLSQQARYPSTTQQTYERIIALAFSDEFIGPDRVVFGKERQNYIRLCVPEDCLPGIQASYHAPQYVLNVLAGPDRDGFVHIAVHT